MWGGRDDPFDMQARMMQRMQQDVSSFGGHQHFRSEPVEASRHARHHPHVEEVHHDTPGSDAQPTVEEPDDEPNTHGQAQAQAQRRARAPPAQQHSVPYRQAPGFPGMDMGFPGMDMGFPGMGMGFPGMASPGMRMMSMGFPGMPFPSMNALMAPQAGSGSSSYSYSSFSSSSGPGIQYQRSSTSRRGPGGIMEEVHTEKDSRAGVEKMSVKRGLGERARTLERVRQADGQELRDERLQGLTDAEAAAFEEEWTREAHQRFMPMGRSGAAQQAHRSHPNHRRIRPS